jgi:hypothetical protein
MSQMKIRIVFNEPLLGTLSGNKEIAEEFIASKNPNGIDQEELDAIPFNEDLEKHSTIFARHEGKPMLWDYQIKGFFKEACEAMINTDLFKKEELKKTKLTGWSYKRTIDKLIFVGPRRIMLNLPSGVPELSFCERPAKVDTMKGPRSVLMRSEMTPEGTSMELEITVLNDNLMPFIERWLDYGALFGMGQWRTSGMGRFIWEELNGD